MGPVLIGILPNNLHCLTRDATLAAQAEARIHNNLFSVLRNKKLSSLNCLFVKICTVQRRMTIKLRFRNRKTQIYTKIHHTGEAGQGVFAEMNDGDKKSYFTGQFYWD